MYDNDTQAREFALSHAIRLVDIRNDIVGNTEDVVTIAEKFHGFLTAGSPPRTGSTEPETSSPIAGPFTKEQVSALSGFVADILGFKPKEGA